MSHDGNSTPVQGGTVQTHLSGSKVLKPPVSEGTAITTEVIYRLCGGRTAQTAFVAHQLQRASELLHLNFSSTSPTQIPTVDLQRPEYRRREPNEINWSTTVGLKEYEWAKIVPQPAPSRSRPRDPLSEVESESERQDESPRNVRSAKNFPRPHPHDSLSELEPESEEENQWSDNVRQAKDLPRMNTPSAIISSSPAPEDSLPFECRCGAEGDGHRFEVQEESVQCETCHRWSHLACQRGLSGMARKPRLAKARFECHRCSVDLLLEMMHGSTAYFRKESKRLEKEKALIDRLLPGKGALVKLGLFFYPCRLISVHGKNWRIKLWSHCVFPPGSNYKSGEYRPAKEKDIRDECWKDHKTRRTIRLGEWKLTHLVKESREDEDTLSTSVIGFTSEIDKALNPDKDLLLALITRPQELELDQMPALAWLRAKAPPGAKPNARPITAAVPFDGGIAKDDWIRIDNWFAHRFKPLKRTSWVSLVSMAHAVTILIATRIQTEKPEVVWPTALEQAWERQVALTGKNLNGEVRQKVDVDLEAVEMLEDRMFDQSEAAGIAGNCQWGLDAGHHQNNWSPYHYNRLSWTDNLREGSDSERMIGRDFVHHRKPGEVLEEQPNVPSTRARPQPSKKSTSKLGNKSTGARPGRKKKA